MTEDPVPVSGAEFALFAGDQLELWKRLEGATIEHLDHGTGRIVQVRQYQGIPLICLACPSQAGDIVYKPDGFRFGRVASIHIPAELAEPFLSWKQERSKQAAEAEQTRQAAEQAAAQARKAAEEWRARNAAEAEQARKAAEAKKTRRGATRQAKCWQCKAPLDNTVDSTCLTCGWIICSCGACASECRTGRERPSPRRQQSSWH